MDDKKDTVSHPNIHAAISAFQVQVPNIEKRGENAFLKDGKGKGAKYATLDDIIRIIRPHLANNGLHFMHVPSGESGLKVVIAHESGQTVEGLVPLKMDKQTAQAMGSAMTYARRYSLVSILGLNVVGEDDDGNEDSKAEERQTAKQIKEHGKLLEQAAGVFGKFLEQSANEMNCDKKTAALKCAGIASEWVKSAFGVVADKGTSGINRLTFDQLTQFLSLVEVKKGVYFFPWDVEAGIALKTDERDIDEIERNEQVEVAE